MLNFYDGHKVYMNGKYPAIFLNGKNVHVHRLEWEKHNGEIPKGYIIHHKDENKYNWSIENLEMIKRSDHVIKHQHNLHNDATRRFGENARRHKLTQRDVDYIRAVYVKYDTHFGGRAFAKKYNVTESCISQIIKNKNWSGGIC